jgi:hypothetical protein
MYSREYIEFRIELDSNELLDYNIGWYVCFILVLPGIKYHFGE